MERYMKKRILTLILATVMTITTMPASVFALNASQGESDINETEVYSVMSPARYLRMKSLWMRRLPLLKVM